MFLPDLRAWGQADRVASRGHLWVQNRQHTWRNVVDDVAIAPVRGSVTIPGLAPGLYRVTWWDTLIGTAFVTKTVPNANGALHLVLPVPLATDVGVRFEPAPGEIRSIHLPVVLKGR